MRRDHPRPRQHLRARRAPAARGRGPPDLVSGTTPAKLLAGVVRNRALRRLVVVQATFVSAEMGSWIAITTVAHGFGGVSEAAAVLVAQLAPAALFAVAVGSLAGRWGQRTVF